MKFFLFLLLIFHTYCSFKDLINNLIRKNKTELEDIKYALNNYLKSAFPNYKNSNESEFLFNNCSNKLFEINNGLPNFVYLLSYSGKDFSDLGNEYSCNIKKFSYYLFSYDYNPKESNSPFVEFFDKNNFYTGICLPNICKGLLEKLLLNYNENGITNVRFKNIVNYSKICKDEFCENDPYYSVDKNGIIDINKTIIEKRKYICFKYIFIFSIVFLCLKALISGLFTLIPNILNKGKIIDSKLIEGNDDYNDEDEEGTDDEITEKVIYNNPNLSREKRESCSEKLIKILYKYFSLFNDILILTLKKSIIYNNKNMEIIYKIKIFSLLMITCSTNFDVYIRFPSRNFFDKSFYKTIYFCFIKFSSFGLDIYICLEGFDALFKFMNYYKKYFFDTNNKTISLKGFFKFYLFSMYKIISFIIIFFALIYLSRYYIYIHYGGKLYFYYIDNIQNENLLKIFNPKYSILSYFFKKDNNIDDFLFEAKMPLLFINEFYYFTIIMIIFTLGIKFKSKIYDYIIFFLLLISYGLTYLCDYIYDKKNELYNYNKITQNISLVKYPHILFNHYLIGAFTGIICFYLKDFSTNNNSMIIDRENCPFKFIFDIIEFLDFLYQKKRAFLIVIPSIIQILICLVYPIIINLRNEEEISLELTKSMKVIFYYESGLFICCFCIITLFLFIKNLDKKNNDNHSIFNLLYQINFSCINTVYLMMYTFYCYYEVQFKLSYQNLWLSTLGFFLLLIIENIIVTIIFVMPFKMFFKYLLNKFFVVNNNDNIQEFRYKSYNSINNETILNQFNPNYQEDDLDN